LNLAIDCKVASIFDLDDAMKVRAEGNRLVAIGKNLEDYNAIDTGIFICPESIFEYLRRVLRDEDCALADGVRLMAEEGNALAIDIGDAWWQDVDTPQMLARAEEEMTRLSTLETGRERHCGDGQQQMQDYGRQPDKREQDEEQDGDIPLR
jgi:1L-myo-inositol 1-phosphate cytidylyltransferase